jgi:hypothetical protein
MTDLVGLLRVLGEARVEFIVAGGVAANILGAVRTTIDVDVIYRRTDENMQRLVSALGPLHPYLRDARRTLWRSASSRRSSKNATDPDGSVGDLA